METLCFHKLAVLEQACAALTQALALLEGAAATAASPKEHAMPLRCVVCGEWDPAAGLDRLDICGPCFDKNFAGANPPLDLLTGAAARTALDAYVGSRHPLTPRQREAIAFLEARWAQEREGRHEGVRGEGGSPESSLTPCSLTPFPSPEEAP